MTLVAETVARDIIRHVRVPLGLIKREDADLARQLRRSASSIALNVSEGERREGRDATYHFRVAAGSAKETQSNLLAAEAWGYVAAGDIAGALAHIDRALGLLWGLTHRRSVKPHSKPSSRSSSRIAAATSASST